MPARRLVISLVMTLLCLDGHAQKNSKGAPRKLREDELRKMVPALRGEYNLSENPRRYAARLTLDQEDNRFPVFWAGHNEDGTVLFRSRMDELSGNLDLRHEGPFTIRITNTARKFGMAEVMPMGGMIGNQPGKEHEFRVVINRISSPVYAGKKKATVGTGKETEVNGEYFEFDVAVEGTVEFNGKKKGFESKGRIGFFNKLQVFHFRTDFTFPAAAVGLSGGNGKPIQARLATRSAVSTKILKEERKSLELDIENLGGFDDLESLIP